MTSSRNRTLEIKSYSKPLTLRRAFLMEKHVVLHPSLCPGVLTLLTSGPQAGLHYIGALLESGSSAAFGNETSLEGSQWGLGLDQVSHFSRLMPQSPSEFVLSPSYLSPLSSLNCSQPIKETWQAKNPPGGISMAKNLRPKWVRSWLMLSGGASKAGSLIRGEGTVIAGGPAGLAPSALQAL